MADNSFIASILAKLDTSQIKADLNKVQKMMDENPGKVQASIDSAQIKQQIASISKSLSESLKLEGIDINSAKIQTQLSSVISQIQNKDKIQLKVDLNKENLLSNMEAFSTSNTKLFASTSTKAKELQAEFVTLKKKIADAGDGTELSGLSKELSTLKNNVKATGLATNSVFTTFKEDLGKFAEFYLAGGITTGTIASIKSIIDNVKELDTAMVDLQMATGDSYSDVSNLMDSYVAMGKELGASATDVSASASDWLRQGKDITDTNTLIKDSMVLAKDGNIEAANATTYLTTATKGYNVAVGDTIGIVDKLTAVDLISATSAGGLAEAMSQTANNANLAGVSMDKLLGYLAVIGETTGESMSSVGNAMSTIFSRMANIKLKSLSDPESAKDLNNVETSLKNVGIALRSDNSTFRNFSDVLDDVAGKWNTMSEVNQRAIAVSIAGKDHMESLLSLMQNYGKAQEYTTAAMNSSGTAMEKFSAYEDSIQARTERLTATMQGLSKDLLNSGVVKTTLDGLNLAGTGVDELIKKVNLLVVAIPTVAIIAFVKNLKELQQLGKTVDVFSGLKNVTDITETTEGITTLKAAYSGLTDKQILAKLATSGLTDAQKAQVVQLVATEGATSAFATEQGVAAAATGGFSTALQGLKVAAVESLAALATNPVTWVVVAIAAVVALVKVYDHFNESISEAKDKLKEFQKEYEDATAKIKDINSQLSDIKTQIDNINSTGGLSITDKEQLQTLKDEEVSLQNQLAIEKEKQKVSQQGATEKAKKVLNATSQSQIHPTIEATASVDDWSSKTVQTNVVNYETPTVQLKEATDEIIKQDAALKQLKQAKQDIANTSGVESDAYKDNEAKINAATDAQNKARSVASGLQTDISDQIKDIDQSSDTYKTAKASIDYYANGIEGLSDGYEKLSDEQKKLNLTTIMSSTGNMAEDDINNFVNSLSSSDLTLAGNIKFNKDSTIDSTKAALKEAQDEANKNPVTSNLTVDFTDPTDLLTQLKSLTDHASMLADVKKEMSESGTIGVDSLQKIAAAYDDMKPYVAQYMQGLISTEDLFNDLQNVYQTDANNYLNAVAAKDATDEDFFKNLLNGNADWVNQFRDDYGIDLNNYGSLAEAKAAIDSQLLQTLSSNWNGYYNAQKDAITGLYSLASNYGSDDSDSISPEQEAARVKQQDAYNRYNDMMTSLNGVTASFESANINTSWQGLSASDSSSSSSSGSSGSSAQQTSKDYDMIATAIDRVERKIKELNNIVSDTSRNWSTRNSALQGEIGAVTDEINTQQAAYNKYMELANNTGLDDSLKSMVQNGSIGVFSTTDENLQKQIDDYKSYFEAALNASESVQTLTEKLSELAKTNFDNFKTQFEEVIKEVTHLTTSLNNVSDLLSAKGLFASKTLENALISTEQQNIAQLEQERSVLIGRMNNALNSGTVEKYSEEWYSMQQDIDAVSESLQSATKSLTDYETALRKVSWDEFDYTRTSVSNLIDETSFLIDLLGNEKLTNTDGTLNANGIAQQGLMAQKYDMYMNQADEYAKEIKNINAELANDPANTTLLSRRQELLKAQQEAISNAESEKKSITSLISDSYTAQENALSKLITKYKDLLDAQKSAADYSDTIGDATKKIADLQKQYNVAKTDTSEEGKKTAQTLKVSLESAKKDLAKTEYEKMISDTEKILEDLQTNFETLLNARLDDINAILSQAISTSNANASSISSTITTAASGVGYSISDTMASIWNSSMNPALSAYSSNFLNSQTNLQNAVNGIAASVAAIQAASEAQAQAQIAAVNAAQAAQGSDNSVNSGDYNYDTGSGSSDSGSGGGGGDAGHWWIDKEDYYPKDQLLTSVSIVDRLKSLNFDSSYDARSQYWDKLIGDGSYYGMEEQNVRLLDWMKSHGYASGSKHISSDQIALTQEKGLEAIMSDGSLVTPLKGGDTVFTNDMTDTLWNLAGDPAGYIKSLNLRTSLPAVQQRTGSTSVSVDFSGMTVTGVNNPKEFMENMRKVAATDKNFQGQIQELALGSIAGNNSLSVRNYM